jgi:TolA-binding protein
MKAKIFNGILILVFFLTGCAYYNTFYNAEQFFEKAAQEREKRLEDMKKNANKNIDRDFTKPTGLEIENYDKAIEKASKVLQLHPKSKYVDDALMLLGQCFYYREDHLKAERKFQELLNNYPQSEFFPEAKLWLARTYIQQEKYEEAKTEFQDIITSRVPREIRDEALLALGELYLIQEDYVTAAHEYLTAVKNVKDKANRSKAALKMGDCYFSLKDYQKSIEGYQLAVKYSTISDIENEALFQLAKSYRYLGQYNEAMKVLQKLLGQASFSDQEPMAKLEMAMCIYLRDKASQKINQEQGPSDEKKSANNNEYYLAIEWLESIIDENPRTEGAARAHYYLGQIYETDYALYDSAYANFMRVKNHNRTSLMADSATAKADAIVQLLGLIEVVKKQTAEKNDRSGKYNSDFDLDVDKVDESALDDTTRYKLRQDRMLRRLKKFVFYNPQLALPDSLIADSLFADSLALVDSIWVRNEDGQIANTRGYYDQFDNQEFKEQETEEERKLREKKETLNRQLVPKIKELEKNQLIQNKLLLAEEYLFQFNNYDSALVQYESILLNFPDSTTRKMRPQILYTMRFIYDEIKNNKLVADSLLKIIAENYPVSPQGINARKTLKLPQLAKADDLALDLFQEAEYEYLENKNVRTALTLYKTVEKKFPTSEYAPKSVYAAAWIYDNVLNENDHAVNLYAELIQKYSETEYAKQAKKKLDNLKIEQEKILAAEKAAATKVVSDSSLAATDSTGGLKLSVAADSVKTVLAVNQTMRAEDAPPAINQTGLEGIYTPEGQFIPRTEPRRPSRILYLRKEE